MIKLTFSCDGCDKTAPGSAPLHRAFEPFAYLSEGALGVWKWNTVESVTPPGWVASDPYTACTYCPSCWLQITAGTQPETKTPAPLQADSTTN